MTTKLAVSCPVCGSQNDGHSEIDGSDAAPSDGDLSICAYCGALSTYLINSMGARLIEVPHDEARELMKLPAVQRALAFIRAVSSAERE